MSDFAEWKKSMSERGRPIMAHELYATEQAFAAGRASVESKHWEQTAKALGAKLDAIEAAPSQEPGAVAEVVDDFNGWTKVRVLIPKPAGTKLYTTPPDATAQIAEWQASYEAAFTANQMLVGKITKLEAAIERMRVAGGSHEFQMAFELAKDLIKPIGKESQVVCDSILKNEYK
jgi:hypothetical protein